MKSFRFSLATLFLAMTALCIVLAHPLGAIVFLIAFPPIFISIDSACFHSFVIPSPKGSSAISRALSVATRPVQGGARADRTRRVRSQTRCEPFRFGVRSQLRAGGIVVVGSSTTG
jgi:hypothetical protein